MCRIIHALSSKIDRWVPWHAGLPSAGLGRKVPDQGRSGINCVNASVLLVFHRHVTLMSEGGKSLVGRSRE